MRSLYSHYRAPNLWSRGKTATDPTALTECIEKLTGYGFHEHAAELQKRYDELTKPSESEAVEVKVVPVEATKPKRARKAKKEVS